MTIYDWSKCKRETLENLAAETFASFEASPPPSFACKELLAAIAKAMKEAAPKPRTRAEVDAEIAAIVRVAFGAGTISLTSGAVNMTGRLEELCAECLAPEPEVRPKCIRCGEHWTPDEGVDATHVECLECFNRPADATEPERCSCEEALALRKRLDAVREILREIAAPGITLEMRKSHALGATVRIWAAIGHEP